MLLLLACLVVARHFHTTCRNSLDDFHTNRITCAQKQKRLLLVVVALFVVALLTLLWRHTGQLLQWEQSSPHHHHHHHQQQQWKKLALLPALSPVLLPPCWSRVQRTWAWWPCHRTQHLPPRRLEPWMPALPEHQARCFLPRSPAPHFPPCTVPPLSQLAPSLLSSSSPP